MPEASAKSLLRSHYPAMDGIRGLALFGVCLAHYGTLAWPGLHDVLFWGFSAADAFFVLSGFLVTGILLDTRAFPRFYRNFYIRRALRILPVFFFVWGVLFVIAAFVHPVWDWYHFSFLLYLGNLYMPAGAAGYHTDPSYFYYLTASGHRFYVTIGHLWTLCQEEQFYLIWPVVITLIPNRKLLFRLCVAGSLAVLALRLYLVHAADPNLIAGDLLYYNPFTRFDSHLIGATLALYVRSPAFDRLTIPRLRIQARWLLAGPLAAYVVLEAVLGHRWPLTHHQPFISTAGFTLECVASAGLLLACLDPGSLPARILAHKIPRELGRISYAFYLFHFLPIQFFANQRPKLEAHHLLFLIPVVALGLSYVASVLSYRFLEYPVLRLKTVLAPSPKGRAIQ